jgi:hypothetical protein
MIADGPSPLYKLETFKYYDKVAYTEVTISRKDLRRLKREWPIQAKAWAQQFKNG